MESMLAGRGTEMSLARARSSGRRGAALGLLALLGIGCVDAVDSRRDPAATDTDGGQPRHADAGHDPTANDDGGRIRTDASASSDATSWEEVEAGESGFTTRVVDGTDLSVSVGGVRVAVLDDTTGLPLTPPVEAISDASGAITLAVQPQVRFAVRAYANATHTDTYSFHYDSDGEHPPIRMGSNNAAVLLPMLAQYAAREDRAPVAGSVLWKTAAMRDYQAVGCARIEVRGADIRALDLRYFEDALPSSLAERPLDRGTNPVNGRFFIANMTPGQHTLVAKLPDGGVLGSTDLVVFARREATTRVAGKGANLFIATLYIDAPDGSENPTPATCGSHCANAPELCTALADAGATEAGPDAGDSGSAPPDAATPDAGGYTLRCADRPCEGFTLSSVEVQPCCVPNMLDQPPDRCGLSADDIKRVIPSSPFTGCLPQDVPYASASEHCGAFFDQIEPEGDHQNGGLDMRSGSRFGVYEGCCLPQGECGADMGVPRGGSQELDLHLGCVSFGRLREALVGASFLPDTFSPFCDPATGGPP